VPFTQLNAADERTAIELSVTAARAHLFAYSSRTRTNGHRRRRSFGHTVAPSSAAVSVNAVRAKLMHRLLRAPWVAVGGREKIVR